MAATFQFTTNAKGEVILTVDGVSRKFPSKDAAIAWLDAVADELESEELEEISK